MKKHGKLQGWRSFSREGRALARTIAAYQQLFAGPDGKLVLRDLARVTGYFEICASEQVGEHNARRAVFQHLLSMLSFEAEELQQLAEQDYQEQLEMSHE